MDPLFLDANRRFDFAKALLSRAQECTDADDERSFCEAAITQAFSCFEGMLSYVFEHFSASSEFEIFEQSIMNEKTLRLVKGRPTLTDQRFWSIEERLQYLFWRFTHEEFDTAKEWWSAFSDAVRVRKGIMHPKLGSEVKLSDARRALGAIAAAIDDLMRTVFGKPWPKAQKGLVPSMSI